LTAVANMKPDSGAYAQFYNVSLTVNPDGSISQVKIEGKPLEADKTYRMATLNFNAIGGDGYPKIDSHPGYVNTGFVDAEVLKGYIEAHSPLK
ncbi:5'-nucleotidase C-terminal domain-containing protein, partial [Pseudomonas marginalis]